MAHNRKWRKLTLAIQERLKEMVEWGNSLQEIANELQVGISTVSFWKKRLGLVRADWRTSLRYMTDIRVQKFRTLHAAGKSDIEIAGAMQIHRQTVLAWRKKLDLPVNSKPYNRVCRLHREPLEAESGRGLRYYEPDEEEFLRAILAFRNKHRRPPTLVEGLRIAKELGWKRPGQGSGDS